MHSSSFAPSSPFDPAVFEPRLRPDEIVDRVLGEELAELAAHIEAATGRFLAKLREFDARGAWDTLGAIACGQWMSHRLGLTPGTAREKLRVARALGELPRIEEALLQGRLSYAKVRALTRVATPENEEQMLALAREAPAAQLERILRGYRDRGEQCGPRGPGRSSRALRQ